MRSQRAFTLVELIVVVAVLAIIATLAAPSFRDFILMQRLKSINAQVVTDMQFARSEAAARNLWVRVKFRSDPDTTRMTCYAIYTMPDADHASGEFCDCLDSIDSACSAASGTKIRIVQIPVELSTSIEIPAGDRDGLAYDPITGSIKINADDSGSPAPNRFVVDTKIDTARALRVAVSLAGRPSVCKPAGSTMTGELCP